MITSDTSVSASLQITEYLQSCNSLAEYVGKSVILKKSGEKGYIKKATMLPDGARYLIHLDSLPPKADLVVWYEDIVIIGEVYC